ncbi:hypothetical protein ND748_02800 [Frankia sp. AiPs1]|uniref:hypothetical protein n=1 Tax=Frankia sp. AiPs1 TaxID=573493 RepID=UPI0020434E00|nr:hypothetical protein [Frankia sp. AiPs1]MCM3920610.1 hypothetical protein [Frankia sp. AiPs1]
MFELADNFAQLAARPGVRADGSFDRARALVRDCVPQAHQDETLRRLDTPGQGQPDAAKVLAAAALGAGFATQPELPLPAGDAAHAAPPDPHERG